MDFSGIGLLLFACCFTAIVPLIPAGITAVVILIIVLAQGHDLTEWQFRSLFLLVYILGCVASCLFMYIHYLSRVRVM